MSKISFTNTRASVLLDLLRGLASLLVIATHWRNIFFVDYSSLPEHGRRFWAPAYLLTSSGHQAVVLFFVLSGFFIAGSVIRSFRSNTWHWGRYLTHRLVRLWIVLLPGLLLCALWDHIGMTMGQAPLLYAGANGNHVLHNVQQATSLRIFFGNVIYLQTLLVPVFGSDTALWSLTNEFWYYMLFPLLLLAFRRQTRIFARITSALIFVLICRFLGFWIALSFLIWMMGAALCVVPPPSGSAAMLKWARRGAGILLVASVYLLPKNFSLADSILGIITAACVWILLSAQQPANPESRFVKASRALSRFSFTLYVVHMPMLILAASLIVHDGRWLPTVPHIAAGLAILMGILVYAWIVASLTEFRTDAVRRAAERILGVSSHPRASVHQQAMSE